MTDPAPATQPTDVKTGQTVVALAVIGCLTTMALGLIVAGAMTGNWAGLQTVGVVVGALATALNAPTGIANALSAAFKPKADDQA